MRLIIIFIFFISILYASDSSNNIRAKILEGILSNISINEKIKVWSDNKVILEELKNRGKLLTTDRWKDANIIILHKKSNLPKDCTNKHIFALNYNLLSDIPLSFGALFYKKGRPNIVIIEPRIKSQSIKISKDLEGYLEEQIW